MLSKLLTLFLLLSVHQTLFAQQYDVEGALNELDQVVKNRAIYVNAHQRLIEQEKKNLKDATFINDQYLLNKKLYKLYKKFDGDSAIKYAERNYRLALDNHRIDWQKESEMNIAQVQITRGVLFLAREMLERCGPIDSFPKELRHNLAIAILNFNKKMEARPASPDIIAQHGRILHVDKNLLISYLIPGTLPYYNGMSIIGRYDNKDVNMLLKLLHNIPTTELKERSKIYFVLAKYAQHENQLHKYYYYLIKSAICDVKSVNRGSQSLLMLIESPFVQKNVNRAYQYAMTCEESAKAYKDYNQSVSILTAQDIIIKSYQTLQSRQRMLLLIGFVIMLLLSATVMFMFLQLKKKALRQKQLYHRLEMLNGEQKKNIDQIKQMTTEVADTNSKLMDEIKLRDHNFIATYYLCSDYIKTYQNFKKAIVNLLKTNSYKEALKKASSTEISDAELKNFYKRFDEAFLSTHVDFVERFNRLLCPEGQFYLDNPNELTPELRIYALISLGINNSVNIADFLHYSPQTIYNYRLRVRHQSCIDEKDFADAVTNIYDEVKMKTYFE